MSTTTKKSTTDYSKWDNLTLSDDSDTECHPNIDKKSFIKWKREALHQERDERQKHLKVMSNNLDVLNLAIKRLKEDNNANIDILFNAIPKLQHDLEKMPKNEHLTELERVYQLIQLDYKGLQKKEDADLSVDKISHEGFSSTRVNIKKKKSSNTTTAMTTDFETINQPSLVIVPDSLKSNKLLLEFIGCKNIDEIYKYIQKEPEVVDSKNQETLLSAAFEYAFAYGEKLSANKISNAKVENDTMFMEGLKRLVFNATFIQYSLQADPRLLYQKFSTIPAAMQQFDGEVANTIKHILSRLSAKMNQPSDGHFFDLSPSAEKSEVLRTCPLKLKEAVIREDIEAFQTLLGEMTEEESSKLLEKFAKVKLIELVAVDSEGNEINEETEVPKTIE